MNEYIEREAAYEDFEKCNSVDPKWTPGRVKALIARQKTADVAPVRHGRWIVYHEADIGYDEYGVRCSNCNFEVEYHEVDFVMNYCPSCGAKMDGDHDG